LRWYGPKEGIMVHTITVHRALTNVGRFLEHAAAIVIGLIMMIVGLGLGVTMIMLPVGVPIGLLGVAMVVAGVFARFDERKG
jgi:type IV secretory pathway TrbD component